MLYCASMPWVIIWHGNWLTRDSSSSLASWVSRVFLASASHFCWVQSLCGVWPVVPGPFNFLCLSHLPDNSMKGWPGPHTATHCIQRGFMGHNSWWEYEAVVGCVSQISLWRNSPQFRIKLSSVHWVLVHSLKSTGYHLLFSRLLRPSTNSSLSGGRADALHSVGQSWQVSHSYWRAPFHNLW